MAIAFRSFTSLSFGSRANPTVTPPLGLQDGDILFAQIVTGNPVADGGAPTPTPPAGFTMFGTAPETTDPSNFNLKFWLAWKRAASESGNYAFTVALSSNQVYLAAYSGAKATGDPLGASSENVYAGNSLVSTGLSITTTATNSFLLLSANNWTGNATTNPTGMDQRYNESVMYAGDKLIAAVGATGDQVFDPNGNLLAADRWTVRMTELLAEGGVVPSSGGLSNGTGLSATSSSLIDTCVGLVSTG